MNDFEKTVHWLQKVELPSFFKKFYADLGDDQFIALLQSRLDTWQKNKRRQDNTVITVGYQGLDIVVKVDNVVICEFTGRK